MTGSNQHRSWLAKGKVAPPARTQQGVHCIAAAKQTAKMHWSSLHEHSSLPHAPTCRQLLGIRQHRLGLAAVGQRHGQAPPQLSHRLARQNHHLGNQLKGWG